MSWIGLRTFDDSTQVDKRVDKVSNEVDKGGSVNGRDSATSVVNARVGADRVSAPDVTANLAVGGVELLDQLLRKAGHFAPLEALRYLTPLISTLGALHETNQAHGNLSLEVLRVTKGDDGALRLQILKGRKKQPKVNEADPKAALSGHMVFYSSGEQIQGAAPTFLDDMYAVGHIAYMLLVGEPYWADEADRMGFMALCKTIMNGLPEAPSVRAMRRKNIRLPHDFDAWFVLITDRKHPDRFGDITDAGIALRSVLSNPDIRELSRSVQFKFNPNILDMPAVVPNAPAPEPEPDNLNLTALFTIIASVSLAVAIVLLLRWSNAHESHAPGRSASPQMQPPPSAAASTDTATPDSR